MGPSLKRERNERGLAAFGRCLGRPLANLSPVPPSQNAPDDEGERDRDDGGDSNFSVVQDPDEDQSTSGEDDQRRDDWPLKARSLPPHQARAARLSSVKNRSCDITLRIGRITSAGVRDARPSLR